MTPFIVSKNPNGSILWQFTWPKDEKLPSFIQVLSKGLVPFQYSHKEERGREIWYVYKAVDRDTMKEIPSKRGTQIRTLGNLGIVYDNWSEPKLEQEDIVPSLPHDAPPVTVYKMRQPKNRKNGRRRRR